MDQLMTLLGNKYLDALVIIIMVYFLLNIDLKNKSDSKGGEFYAFYVDC